MFQDGVLTVVFINILARDLSGPTRLTSDDHKSTAIAHSPSAPPKCHPAVTLHCCTRRTFKIFLTQGRQLRFAGPLPVFLTAPEETADRTPSPRLLLRTPSHVDRPPHSLRARSQPACARRGQPITANPYCSAPEPKNPDPSQRGALLRQLTVLPCQFQALLTPTSRSFSTFPHGTCLLSVSL